MFEMGFDIVRSGSVVSASRLIGAPDIAVLLKKYFCLENQEKLISLGSMKKNYV